MNRIRTLKWKDLSYANFPNYTLIDRSDISALKSVRQPYLRPLIIVISCYAVTYLQIVVIAGDESRLFTLISELINRVFDLRYYLYFFLL